MRPAISVKGLSLGFNQLQVLKDVSFDVPQGSIFGLVGPNGAGKTTLFNVISGLYPPQAGEVQILGQDMKSVKVHQYIQYGLARTFQNIRLLNQGTALENILLALDHHPNLQKAGFFASLFNSQGFKNWEGRKNALAQQLMDLLGLRFEPTQRAGDLPYGEKRKLEILRAIATGAQVILLDEPAAGLNSKETQDLASLIRLIRDELQLTLLVVEHDMSLISQVCDEVVVLEAGKIIFQGPPEQMLIQKGIVHVPEGRGIFTQLTVEENLMLGGAILGSKVLRQDRLEKVYQKLPKLKERRLQWSGTLSGGEQQILAIGRALIGNPRLLLLDEPSLGLSPQMTDEVFELIYQLNQEGMTILWVEQNATRAIRNAPVSNLKGLVLDAGRVVFQGNAKELIDSTELQSAYLGVSHVAVT